ncbi:MAG: arginine--tRNA ligase [Ignavibacteriae bacterium]|nr:arginine--tRNA ligase [Ignavibacteriota bacterium]
MKDYIRNSIIAVLNELGYPVKDFVIDEPKDSSFGDLSANIALVISKELKKNPREVAGNILEKLLFDESKISKSDIAGPGFLNFFVSDDFYRNELINILSNENYGKMNKNSGKTANLEWVSANPTGPLHAGHGRQVCLGKAIANLLEWTGFEVTREYYYNDAGNQMNNLAKSIKARYEQIMNPDYPFPEDGYVGEYIKEIAEKIFSDYNDKYRNSDDLGFFKSAGEQENFGKIKATLKSFGIQHDVFFNETSLYKDGNIDKLKTIFKNKNLSYEKDGATWLKMNEKKFDKDKVIVKATGEPTYRLPDMAYHIDKILRGYNLIVDIFGSDHFDTYKEVLYGVQSAGFNTDNIKVIIHQMVTFKKGNESVKMSKRSDNVYYLDDLIKDVGIDATQFFFIMRAANTHLDFDIELAKDQSDKNPVYYLQYAHARICGILRNAEENFSNINSMNVNELDTSLLINQSEINLLKTLSKFPFEVEDSAKSLEPHKLIVFLNSVAESFHKFYHNNRVLDNENPKLSFARLLICNAVKRVLKNGFCIIGINAPERM